MQTTQEVTLLSNGSAAAAIAGDNSTGLPLLAHHQVRLTNTWGLSIDTIREERIESVVDVGQQAALLNRKRGDRKLGSCIRFPVRDAIGTVVSNQLRPDRPPINRSTGKPRKYLSPSGEPPRLFVPARTFPILSDPTARLLITEGIPKALKASQEGFHCISIPGVDNWHAKGKTTLSPDLDRIEWKGRPTFIVFDSDAVENENVGRNERELAAALAARGAVVKIVRIPHGPPDSEGKPTKLGVDDYLVAHGPAAFQKLLESAEEPEPPTAGEYLEAAADMDPAIEAEHILATVKLGELSKLRYWRGSWCWWSNGRYAEKPLEEVRAEVVNLLNRRYMGLRSRHVSDVFEHLKAKAILSSSIEPPAWLGAAPRDWPANECLATKNAIIHLPSLVANRQPCEVPASPALLATSATDFPLDLNASKPSTWLEFLASLWGEDPQSIDAMQEWFGYLLTHDTRQQKMLLLVGPKRSGKGTIARILTALVGKANVAAPTLGGLATNFGLWPLIGKSVAIISDARLSGRADQAAVVERLLSISGEDSITVDRKNMQPITLRLPTRFIILTNELPKLSDASGAIVSRVILLHTTRSFYGHEDHDLTDKLLAELPGILLWAIEGWRRIRERGQFIQPDSGRESLGEMNDLASPVAAFVRDCCEVGLGEVVLVAELFAAWEKWCKTQGRERFAGTAQAFGRDLLAVEPHIRRSQPRDHGGRVRVYQGIGLKVGF
jgi:putative DNA primase/helicase